MISLRRVGKVFNPGQANEMVALREIDLDIQCGEFVVLIGANGSGKTTLLNLIAGTEYPTTGAVFIRGEDVTRTPEYRRARRIARVFQNPHGGTAPDLSILDNFRLAALRTRPKMPRIGINDKFKKLVSEKIAMLGMGLENKLNQPMGALSGGQRQALTLLMSVMDHTDILLLDEPAAALDPRSAEIVMHTADHIIQEYGLTTVLITHNLKDACRYGSRLIQMAEGSVARDLKAEEKRNLSLATLHEWFN